jgi:long-subunit fatty acid transport protein
MARFSKANFPYALALLAAGATLPAQGIFGLSASDPAGIARSGAGVAYGRSLEAASLNPALLATLTGKGGVFLAGGQEFQAAQDTLQSNQNITHSTDRNRLLPAFGAGWRVTHRFALGLKVDSPYLRHAAFGPATTTRFLADELSVEARRAEVQVAFAVTEAFSVGFSAGSARIDFASGAALRVAIPTDPTKPLAAGNPSLALLEQQVRQEGSVTVPTASVGLRWAINPRWTLGFAYQGPLEGDVALTAEFGKRPYGYVANDGFGAAPVGIGAAGGTLRGLLKPQAGTAKIHLPARAALGLRHRATNAITWEADLRYTDGEQLALPGQPGLLTPSGVVANPSTGFAGQRALGLSLMGELALTKVWTLRAGMSLDQSLRDQDRLEPVAGGAATAAFSIGAAYQIGRGELSLGYQVRQAQDVDAPRLDGVWSITGYRSTGTVSRVENSGHLYSLGYKVSF